MKNLIERKPTTRRNLLKGVGLTMVKGVGLSVVTVLGKLIGEPDAANATYSVLGCTLWQRNDPSRCAAFPGYPRRFWVSPLGARCVEVSRLGSNPANCRATANIICSYAYIP